MSREYSCLRYALTFIGIGPYVLEIKKHVSRDGEGTCAEMYSTLHRTLLYKEELVTRAPATPNSSELEPGSARRWVPANQARTIKQSTATAPEG